MIILCLGSIPILFVGEVITGSFITIVVPGNGIVKIKHVEEVFI